MQVVLDRVHTLAAHVQSEVESLSRSHGLPCPTNATKAIQMFGAKPMEADLALLDVEVDGRLMIHTLLLRAYLQVV